MVKYLDCIHASIDYIEENLDNEISVEEVASQVGYSKYHFIKLFQNETGMTVYKYIRNRRLSLAASLLLNSTKPIFEIALISNFDSQEAFSRAFKEIYQLPPNKYRKTMKNLLNGGQIMEANNEITGWIFTGGAPERYSLYLDTSIYHTGKQAASIVSKDTVIEKEDFATVMQNFSAEKFRNKRVRFSAFVKSNEVEEWAGLWMRIDNGSYQLIKFDNMQDRPIFGTTEWNLYSCVLDVPFESEVINIGLLLTGKGQVWLDNACFEEVDTTVSTTDFTANEILKEYPENLEFEM